MPTYFDLPLPQLREHVCAEPEPADLDRFWSETLAESRGHEIAATFTPASSPLTVVSTFDVTFAGFGGHPIRGWLHLPRHAAPPLPCVVEDIGYGGGRGRSHEHIFWAAAGFAHFVMDTRGQGAGWSVGRHARTRTRGRRPTPGPRRGDPRPGRLLLPPPLHRRGACGRRRAPASRGRRGSYRGCRHQPGRRPLDCRRVAARRRRGGGARGPLPRRHAPRGLARRHQPVPRGSLATSACTASMSTRSSARST